MPTVNRYNNYTHSAKMLTFSLTLLDYKLFLDFNCS